MSARKLFAPNRSFVYTVFILAVYAALAIALLTTSWPNGLPSSNRLILAAILIIYVAFRGYRLYKRSISERNFKEEGNE
jgi:hypothetical protein